MVNDDMKVGVTLGSALTIYPDDPQSSLGHIDQYEILRELGGGGFGSVYLARNTVSGIEVAIKGLPQVVRSNREELESIRQNFALVIQLHHPNIAAALDLHPAQNVVYNDESARRNLRVLSGDTLMVMEYAPGVTLSSWRRQFPEGCVPVQQALAIIRQIAAALDYAHERKIIHRDVKPANVMIETLPDESIRVRVLDFGLAAEIRTSLGRVSREIRDTSGTRPYMAPEQWLGQRQGAWSDQYSLAVLFHELVFGDVPFASVFQTGDPVVMMNVVSRQAVTFPRGTPQRLKAALGKALSKNGEERFDSCTQFVDVLDGKLPMPSPSRTGLKIGVAIAFLAGVAIAFWGVNFMYRGESPASQVTHPIAVPPDTAPTNSPVLVPVKHVHVHRFGEWTTNVVPICGRSGRRIRVCSAAGCTFPPQAETNELAELAHRWHDWSVATPAKPGVEGLEKRGCLYCAMTETRSLPALPVPQLSLTNRTPTVQELLTAKELESLATDGLQAGVLRRIDLGRGCVLAMRWCPPGTYMMGSPVTESGRGRNETLRQVRIDKGFWLGQYEVTQAQWQRVMERNPSKYIAGDGEELPVDSITLKDSEDFAAGLNRLTGVTGFRLPSSAEWEYACRAGTTTPFAVPEGQMNCAESRLKKTTRVGAYKANAWGFHDMHGNVGEWTPDDFMGKAFQRDGKTICGGCWRFHAVDCRSAARRRVNPRGVEPFYGMRICFQSYAR